MPEEKDKGVATREELAKAVLEGFKLRYSALCEDWKSLESKASTVVTLSGIFFAGLFAVARATQEQFTCPERVCLTLSLVAIISAVLAAANVLRLRDVAAAPLGDDLKKLVDDLNADTQPITDEEKIYFVNDHADLWRNAVTQLHNVNESKASSLFWAQILVLAGMVLFVVAAFLKIWW